MATRSLPAGSDTRTASYTAHHTISVEPYEDRRCLEVHEAVVERFRGVVVCVCCRDVDLLRGATLDEVAHRYAEAYEADYLPSVVPAEVTA